MDLTPFRPTGTSVSISATTASTANQLATATAAGMSLRVVNEAGVTALVSISTSTSPDATADAKTMAVLGASERIFEWPPGGNTVGVALRSGTGTVQIQLGKGV
jgi:hypothetical protein